MHAAMQKAHAVPVTAGNGVSDGRGNRLSVVLMAAALNGVAWSGIAYLLAAAFELEPASNVALSAGLVATLLSSVGLLAVCRQR